MLEVFRDGVDAEVSLRDGVESVRFPSAAWRLVRQRYGEPSEDIAADDNPTMKCRWLWIERQPLWSIRPRCSA